MVPASPTTVNSAPDQAMSVSRRSVTTISPVHWTPSGEVRIVPTPPTATKPWPDQATPIIAFRVPDARAVHVTSGARKEFNSEPGRPLLEYGRIDLSALLESRLKPRLGRYR